MKQHAALGGSNLNVLVAVLLARRLAVGPIFWAISALMMVQLLVLAFLFSGLPTYIIRG